MSRLSLACPLAASLLLSACVEDAEPGPTEADTGSTAAGSSSESGPGATDPDSATAPDDPTTGVPDDSTTTDPAATTTTAPGTTGDPDTTAPGTTADDTTTTTTADDTTTTADTSTTADDTTTTTTDTGDGLEPDLPIPTKPCPELIDGTVEFHPDGLASPRDVRIWMDPEVAAEKDGPLVFYWYGTGGEPDQALAGVGELGIQEILDLGGIVVAPTHDPGAGVFPWHLVLSEKQDDLLLADEVLACAQEQIGVDPTRIHSLGFSAGALHTAQMSIRRSDYLASVTTYSGGLIFGSMPEFAEQANDFPAMIFHGGQGDVVVVGFKQASEDYAAYLAANDDFSFICDHGMGHTIPPEQDSVMQFFADHPWGTMPEPYASGLPDGFPAYCTLP